MAWLLGGTRLECDLAGTDVQDVRSCPLLGAAGFEVLGALEE
jgi:hypothetical protein